jgi:hypothetical protein
MNGLKVNNKIRIATADDWESNINYYQDLAIRSRKWFFSWLALFLFLCAVWLFLGDIRILHVLIIISLTSTLISFINFQTKLLRGDMAMYHYVSMKKMESLHSKPTE